jgi:hypothetical protein
MRENVKLRNIKGVLHCILFAVFKQSEPVLQCGFISNTPSTMYCHCTVYTFPATCRAREGEQPGPSDHTKFFSNAASEAKSDKQE